MRESGDGNVTLNVSARYGPVTILKALVTLIVSHAPPPLAP